MKTLDFSSFFRYLEAGVYINETCFYFSDDADETERYLGFLPQYDEPYWVGYCDIPDGAEFQTAEDLVSARIYHGKSLKERWDSVQIISIMGIPFDEWQTRYRDT